MKRDAFILRIREWRTGATVKPASYTSNWRLEGDILWRIDHALPVAYRDNGRVFILNTAHNYWMVDSISPSNFLRDRCWSHHGWVETPPPKGALPLIEAPPTLFLRMPDGKIPNWETVNDVTWIERTRVQGFINRTVKLIGGKGVERYQRVGKSYKRARSPVSYGAEAACSWCPEYLADLNILRDAYGLDPMPDFTTAQGMTLGDFQNLVTLAVSA